MGYFPNGTAGDIYEDTYCANCLNWRDGMCAVHEAHLFHNYEECNNPDSILHVLIPRDKETGENKQCAMFLPDASSKNLLKGVSEAKKYLEAFGFTVEKKTKKQ